MTVTLNDIKDRDGVRVVPYAQNPELIKVKAIRAKYLDQMPRHGGRNMTDIPACEVIGATSAFVVLVRDDGYLFKVHRTDWLEHLIKDVDEAHKARIRAEKQIDRYPQLFED